jgi:hypothetical protein
MTASRQGKCECDRIAAVLSTYYKDHKRVNHNIYQCDNCDEKFKRCKTCKIFKNFNSFHKHKCEKFGLKNLCKLCASKTQKQDQKNNPEKWKQRGLKYYKNNRENLIKRSAKWYKNNREKAAEAHSKYYYKRAYHRNENLIEIAKLLHNLKKERRNAIET